MLHGYLELVVAVPHAISFLGPRMTEEPLSESFSEYHKSQRGRKGVKSWQSRQGLLELLVKCGTCYLCSNSVDLKKSFGHNTGPS